MERIFEICIIGRKDQISNYKKAFEHNYLYYSNTISFHYHIPLEDYTIQELILNNKLIAKYANACNLLLLPGGFDLHPSLLKENYNGTRKTDYPLDALQFKFMDVFLKKKRAIIGICKGMQLINIYFGGTLIQHMTEHACSIHEYITEDKIHDIWVFQNTCKITCLCQNLNVNSAHHQCIDTLGIGLKPLHYSSDQVIETIYHETLPIIGVQWHPERYFSSDGKNNLVPIAIELLFLYNSIEM